MRSRKTASNIPADAGREQVALMMDAEIQKRKERDEQTTAIEQAITQLDTIFSQLSQLVHDQGAQLERIDADIFDTQVGLHFFTHLPHYQHLEFTHMSRGPTAQRRVSSHGSDKVLSVCNHKPNADHQDVCHSYRPLRSVYAFQVKPSLSNHVVS